LVIPLFGTLSVTLPLVPPPVSPAPAVTPVIVPVPGNVCPETKFTTPLLSIVKAVPETESVGALPLGNRVRVPGGRNRQRHEERSDRTDV
jgi:hypothetical protein